MGKRIACWMISCPRRRTGHLWSASLYAKGPESAGPSAKAQEKDPPYVLPIRTDNRQTLEAELFTRSYKGDRSGDKMALAAPHSGLYVFASASV